MKDSLIILSTICAILFIGFGIGAAVYDKPKPAYTFTPEQCFAVPTGQRHTTADPVVNGAGEVQGIVPKITGVEWLTRCEKSEWRAP